MKKDVINELTTPVDHRRTSEKIAAKVKGWCKKIYEQGDLGNPYFLATVILAVLAAVGLTASVIAIVNLAFQGQTNADLKAEIATLTDSNKTLRQEARKNSNPVLRMVGVDDIATSFVSQGMSDGRVVRLWIRNGKIMFCMIGYPGGDNTGRCEINGITEEIYKAVDVSFGATSEEDAGIGLITKLGALYYVPMAELVATESFTVTGKINFERPIIDILQGLALADDGEARNDYVPVLIFSNNEYRKLRKEEVAR